MKNILLVFVLLFSFDCYAIKPVREYVTTPDSLGMRYEQQRIKTVDGYLINTWVIKPAEDKDTKTTLVLTYADSGNMSYWLYHIKALTNNGFTVVAYDYRGFGESSDFEINPLNLYYNEFATDLQTVLGWTKKNIKGNRTGVLAFSMGTIVATLALQHEKVDFLIGEGYVYEPDAYASKIKLLKDRDIVLPKGAYRYSAKLRKIKCNMLLVAGEKDKFTTIEDSEKIARQRNNRATLTHSGNHTEGFITMTQDSFGDLYIKELTRFSQK
ncbi:alpha/beta hydrolase family protein [Pontibacter amylolyticus]|uniref:Alpha/beta hydrolase n=1 Tax=Pontibacter amylolyticus TaxID=1424080 RepID=A0ABQ1W2B9_9BACT|nr:alpha/beta fold hydrolase [Pontibacter amylolyticus]GGG08475.1 alpha/beta hydrolase [Pontibacter amylolyticus]